VALYRSPFTVVEPLVSRPHGFDSLIVGYCSGKDLVVQWDLRESMTEAEVEIILQRAREKYPEAKPRIISDNGSQFIARDFKEFIRIAGMTHVRTSPYYPLAGRQAEIHAARDRKLEEARHQRQLRRAAISLLAHSSNPTTMTSPGETDAGSAGMQPC